MLKIAICEDEIDVCFYLEDIIKKACEQLREIAMIDIFSNVSEIKRELKQKTGYHLLFLDIELQDGTGIDIGHFLRDTMGDDLTTPTGKPVGFSLPSVARNRTSFSDFGVTSIILFE